MKNKLSLLTFRKSSALLQAGVIAFASLLPVMLLSGSTSASQLTARSIDMSANQTSEGSGRDGGDGFGQDVTYRVNFTLATAHANLRGVVIEFCNSPLVGTACVAPTGFNTNNGTLAVTPVTGVTGTWAKTSSTTNRLILTKAAGDNLAAAAAVSFDLGTAAVSDGITNPTSIGSFYARIVTYTSDTNALGYTDTNPDAVGAHIDDGGIAMAVANELTITARVQEVLQFCVGTTDANALAGALGDCTEISGTNVDLGVVDSTTVNTTTAAPAKAMIRTNAFGGASIYYKAEQNGGTPDGKLKIAGVTCLNNTSALDQCFNSVIGGGTTSAPVGATIVAGTENFGMTLTSVDTTNGGATTNLTRNVTYDGNGATAGTCTAADAGTNDQCWAWADSGVFDTIASSSSVLDDEMVNIAFAATASATTPTGLYTVTANFVATATF